MSSGPRRRCASCSQSKAKNQYGKNQWDKGTGSSRCKQCSGVFNGGGGGGSSGSGGGGGGKPVCTYFQQGRCNKGASCNFSHDPGGCGGGEAAVVDPAVPVELKVSRDLLEPATTEAMNMIWSVLDANKKMSITVQDYPGNQQWQQVWALLQQGGFDKSGTGTILTMDFMDTFINIAVQKAVTMPPAPTTVTVGQLLLEFKKNLNDNVMATLKEFAQRIHQFGIQIPGA